MASGPLAGVKVLEFSQIIAGPFAGMMLSDMGAEVTKFEPLEGAEGATKYWSQSEDTTVIERK